MLISSDVYVIKYKPDKSMERYKIRLIVKGFSSKYGINYLETFAHIVKYTYNSCFCCFGRMKIVPT